MKTRLGIALLVLLGLTAFAPAPFPRTQRRGERDEITLKTFQGRWRVAKVELTTDGGTLVPYLAMTATHVRITHDRWTFMDGGREGGSRAVALDHGNNPPLLSMSDWPDVVGHQLGWPHSAAGQGDPDRVW